MARGGIAGQGLRGGLGAIDSSAAAAVTNLGGIDAWWDPATYYIPGGILPGGSTGDIIQSAYAAAPAPASGHVLYWALPQTFGCAGTITHLAQSVGIVSAVGTIAAVDLGVFRASSANAMPGELAGAAHINGDANVLGTTLIQTKAVSIEVEAGELLWFVYCANQRAATAGAFTASGAQLWRTGPILGCDFNPATAGPGTVVYQRMGIRHAGHTPNAGIGAHGYPDTFPSNPTRVDYHTYLFPVVFFRFQPSS